MLDTVRRVRTKTGQGQAHCIYFMAECVLERSHLETKVSITDCPVMLGVAGADSAPHASHVALLLDAGAYAALKDALTTGASETALLPRHRYQANIARALSYIHAKYRQKVALDLLADLACLSRSGFSKAFKKATGYSPIDYLVCYRIEAACSLLRETDSSILSIAYEVGFSDSNHFSRQFRRKKGMSASLYRKTHAHAAPRLSS